MLLTLLYNFVRSSERYCSLGLGGLVTACLILPHLGRPRFLWLPIPSLQKGIFKKSACCIVRGVLCCRWGTWLIVGESGMVSWCQTPWHEVLALCCFGSSAWVSSGMSKLFLLCICNCDAQIISGCNYGLTCKGAVGVGGVGLGECCSSLQEHGCAGTGLCSAFAGGCSSCPAVPQQPYGAGIWSQWKVLSWPKYHCIEPQNPRGKQSRWSVFSWEFLISMHFWS